MNDTDPTERELQVLKVLWQDGEATVREVWKVLSASDTELAYTTALSLMQVMEQKGLVKHRADGKAYVYSPLVKQQSVFRQMASRFLKRVFDGAVDEYLVHALAGQRPSDAELDRMEHMLAAARERTKTKRKAGDAP
ncbi:MAG: BlaI/MecI/CopY family transcriptional regulator [Planctomycetota bacterium]